MSPMKEGYSELGKGKPKRKGYPGNKARIKQAFNACQTGISQKGPCRAIYASTPKKEKTVMRRGGRVKRERECLSGCWLGKKRPRKGRGIVKP